MPPKAGTRRTAAKPEASASGESSQNAPAPAPAQGSSATPGPSGRPPVQRLQTLKKRTPGGSITPSTRSPSALGGDPAPKPMKFRPKAVQRKTKEEREAIERIEQERNDERLREAAAIQRGRGGSARGSRGSFRGRGGAMGMGAGGPLGSGFGGSFRGRGGGGGGGGHGSGGGMGRGRVRSGYTAGSGDQEYDSSDDDLRVSIDNINIESDEDDDFDDVKGKMPVRRREKGLRPVRVTRHEHEERVVHVNMESSSNKAAEIREQAQKEAAEVVDDKSSPEEDNVDQPQVKPEPTEDNDLPMEDVPAADDDFLPRQRYRVRRKTSDPEETEDRKPLPPMAPKRDPRELLRTKEEIDEYDRHEDDLRHVRELLTHREPEPEPEPEPDTETETEKTPTAPETTAGDGEGQNKEEPIEKLANEHLLGQLFLMQFPPMTPNLITLGSKEAATSGTSQPQTQDQPEIKPENGDQDVQITGEGAAESAGPSEMITAATNWSLPAGRVGKLNVHKSGRVTMDWGGISFELDRAAGVDFVQEALIVSQPEVDSSGQPPKDDRRYEAWSMGQLSGKFTVMPNWDSML